MVVHLEELVEEQVVLELMEDQVVQTALEEVEHLDMLVMK
jgi:hypothetical protein